MAEHEERLKEHNWTEEDFEAGFQEGSGPIDGFKDVSENFLAYQALVKDTLATGEVRTVPEGAVATSPCWFSFINRRVVQPPIPARST